MSSIGLDNRLADALGTPPSARDSVADHFRQVRDATVELCEPLEDEDYVAQSMPDASPTKWHLAHTSWFFEEFVLQPGAADYRFYDDRFRYLFNSYYNAVGPMHERPRRGVISRPTVAEVLAYRTHVDEQMQRFLSSSRFTRASESPAGESLRERIVLGLHHEQQHQELLLTDLKHLFSCNPLLPAYEAPRDRTWGDPPACRFVRFPGGISEIGHDGTEFSFDNERPRHRTYLEPFALASRLVTNGEYRDFIRDGGYTNASLWLSDGWNVVQREQWNRPIYWADSLEQEFTLLGLREINSHAPVCHVSYYEADAFARWAQARLPAEAEWEVAARESSAGAVSAGNFVESRNWHPVPATTEQSADAPPRLTQMFGDVWEWTRSGYDPYPGFQALTGALGEYNGKFMVNQLILRGGSCATPKTHIRATYRNFFPPSARWQFTGLRLAQDG
ncbi:MAG TPA: ergothioneine biosynthesis protein EgtB [Steroidobacteraceae bacterium]|jgi:ergothioneine biosynthesis protein EgtB